MLKTVHHARTRAAILTMLLIPAAVRASASSPPELRAVKAAKPPVIDGVVADEEWTGASVATDFVQFEPRRGEPASGKTDVLVLYDATHLYVAFRVWDAEPPTAQLTQRDVDLFSDDAVSVLIDSYFDRRSAYYFTTNILGTQADGRVADDGRLSDGRWDAPWRSAARRTGFGWTAEFAIPFISIKYASGENRTWGINFSRSRRRSLEFSTWAGLMVNRTEVSRSGRLVGLDLEPPTRRHQIAPYGLSLFQKHTASVWQAGIDARYATTSQTALYATINPDFATIEADQEQVNLTRLEVPLPEKRQFFLDGQELFTQRIRTFYSRRIADITAGGKLLGREGPWTMALISAESDPIAGAGRANYTVGRLQRDIFGRSSVGVMTSNRRLSGVNEGAVSIDTSLHLTKTLNLTAQAVKSWGRFGQGTTGFEVRPAYESATTRFHVRYTSIGNRVADNVNAIGQVVEDDRREINSAVQRTFWIKSGFLEQVVCNSAHAIYWSQNNILRSWVTTESIDTQLRSGWSTGFTYTEEFKRFEKDFRNRQIAFRAGFNTRAYQSVRVGYATGRNFDSDFRLWTATARYKVSSQLSAEYELERLTIEPDPRNQRTWIHVVRADQFFTRDLYLHAFFQTNSAIDRHNLQLVLVWRYLPPFGTLQIAYQRGTAAFGQRSDQGHTLFLKATTVF